MKQLSPLSCGYAAIKTLLVEYRGAGYAYVSEPKLGFEPPSLSALVKYASALGLVLLPLKALHPKEEFFAESEFPTLLRLEGKKGGHIVIAYKRIGNLVILLDPGKGRTITTVKALSKRWDGVYLQPIAYPLQRKEVPVFVPTLRSIFLFILGAIYGCLIILSLFYTLGSLPFLTCLGASLLTFLLSRVYLRFLFVSADNKAKGFLLSHDHKKERYQKYEYCLGVSLSTPLRLASSFTSVLAIVALVVRLSSEVGAFALGALLGEALLALMFHKGMLPKANARFDGQEEAYFQKGDEPSLSKLFKMQRAFASFLDLYGLLRLALLLVPIFLYANLTKLDLQTSFVLAFLLLPLKDLPESVFGLYESKGQFERAKAILFAPEDS